MANQVVFVLTASADAGGGDWDGITTVHASRISALHHLGLFLDRNDIDRDAAHYGAHTDDHCICNDPDPDTLNGVKVHWGINRAEVIA